MNTIRLKRVLKNHFENGFSFYFSLFLVFIFGIIVGALIIKATSPNAQIGILKLSSSYFYSIFKGISNKYEIFKVSIIFNLLFVLFIYIFGLINLGFIIPLLIFIKGGSLGFIVGYLISNFGWKGFFVSILGLYPQYLLFIPCIITIGALSMTISLRYKFSSRGKKNKVKRLDLIEYTAITLIVKIVILIGSIYEGFISPIFLNIVNDIL